MAKLKKIGKMYYSDLRIAHKRVRLALSIYRPKALRMLDDLIDLRRAKKHNITPKNVSWMFFKERYNEYCATDKSIHTTYRDNLAFRMIDEVTQIFGLEEMTPKFLEGLKFLWKEKGYTQSVITRAVKSIKTAMRKAEEWEYITPQNWQSVKVIEPVGRIDYYEVKALESLLNSLQGIWKLSAVLMSRCGLRCGEVYFLESTDVQLNHNRIFFRSKPHLGWKIKGDKKGNKKRVIPIKNPKLLKYLKAHVPKTGFVLGSERPENLILFYKLMENAIVAANIKTVEGDSGGSHILRHTFASHLAQRGASMKSIADLLGHTQEKMAEIYSHLSPESVQQAIELLPEINY